MTRGRMIRAFLLAAFAVWLFACSGTQFFPRTPVGLACPVLSTRMAAKPSTPGFVQCHCAERRATEIVSLSVSEFLLYLPEVSTPGQPRETRVDRCIPCLMAKLVESPRPPLIPPPLIG